MPTTVKIPPETQKEIDRLRNEANRLEKNKFLVADNVRIDRNREAANQLETDAKDWVKSTNEKLR